MQKNVLSSLTGLGAHLGPTQAINCRAIVYHPSGIDRETGNGNRLKNYPAIPNDFHPPSIRPLPACLRPAFQPLPKIRYNQRIWGKKRASGPPFEGSGQGNQSFQLWSDTTNMPHGRSQDEPDQDGLVTIDTPVPANPRRAILYSQAFCRPVVISLTKSKFPYYILSIPPACGSFYCVVVKNFFLKGIFYSDSPDLAAVFAFFSTGLGRR